jgi:hypothetical protein
VTLDSRLADERRLQLGIGLGVVAPLAASTAIDRLLGSFEPAELTVCVRFRVRELRKPMGFCNPYFDSFSPLGDIGTAATLVDSFDLPPLHVRGAAVSMELGRGFASDVVTDAEVRGRVRAGSSARVRVSLRRRGGGRRTIDVDVPVPAGMRPGRRTLVLEGNGLASPEDEIIDVFDDLLFGGYSPSGGREPRTPRQLARAIAGLRRPLGIEAHFRHRDPRVVLRSNDVRFEGRVRVSVRVARARR